MTYVRKKFLATNMTESAYFNYAPAAYFESVAVPLLRSIPTSDAVYLCTFDAYASALEPYILQQGFRLVACVLMISYM